MSDYTEKIKRLLALAESPNEHEARSALLKAREFMARHKISEAELENKNLSVERIWTGITFSARRDPWIYDLASVIAANHCCHEFRSREKGRQTGQIGFLGFSEDAAFCTEIFKYAVECVRLETKKLRKLAVKAADNYGYGFMEGLSAAYEEQKAQDWALVLVVPKEVNEACGNLQHRKVKTEVNTAIYTFQKGVEDGRRFHDQKRIREADDNKKIGEMQNGRYSA